MSGTVGTRQTGDERSARTYSIRRRDFLTYAAAAGFVASAGGLLAACGGGNSAATATTGSTSGGTTPAASTASSATKAATTQPASSQTGSPAAGASGSPAAVKPVGDQKLTAGISNDPGGSVDPRYVFDLTGISTVSDALYDPLMIRSDKMEILPYLASSWEWSDPLNLLIKLRTDVKFQNGEPFDSSSVKATFDSYYDPATKAPVRGLLPVNGKVEVVDDHSVKYVLEKPYRPLPTILPWIKLLPPKALASGFNFATNSAGTGRYTLKEYQPNDRVVMTRYPNYWGEQPLLDQITIRYFPEDGTRVAALKTGEVLMINNPPTDQLKSLESDPNLEVRRVESLRIMNLTMQCDQPPFDKIPARQAICYAIDRDALVKGILQGYGQVAKSVLSPYALTYRDDLPPYPYDPKKAKDLLSQAGVASGTKISLGTSNGRYLMDQQIAEACAQYLEDVGFSVSLDAPEYSVYLSNAYGGKYSMYLSSRTGATTANDPSVLSDFYTPNAAQRFKYSNPEVDKLLEQGLAAASASEAELNQIYGKVQEIVWQEAPWAVLYYLPSIVAVNKKLKGFEPRADEMYYFFTSYIG